jgi:hypothetical protein
MLLGASSTERMVARVMRRTRSPLLPLNIVVENSGTRCVLTARAAYFG